MARHRPHLLLRIPDGARAVPVDDEAHHHLARVLRYQPGDPVTYTDGSGLIGEGVYEGDVVLRGEESTVSRVARLTVAVAPPASSNRVRFLVEKLAEIGVDRLVWLRTRFAEGRPPRPEKATAWARAALEQSRGAWLMTVDGQMVIADIAGFGTPLFAEPGGGLVTDLPPITDPVLCVGPEGGFADEEIPEDAIRVSLGDRVLRVETAAIAGAVLLENRF